MGGVVVPDQAVLAYSFRGHAEDQDRLCKDLLAGKHLWVQSISEQTEGKEQGICLHCFPRPSVCVSEGQSLTELRELDGEVQTREVSHGPREAFLDLF